MVEITALFLFIFEQKKKYMINFDALTFSDDLQELYIDCYVDDTQDPDEDWNITRIYLEYYKNRNATFAPSDKALKVFEGSSRHVQLTGENPVKASQLSVELNGVGQFEGGLFYVLVETTKITPAEDPEEEPYVEHKYDVGVVLDWWTVYTLGMQQVAKMTKRCNAVSCDIPDYFEQFVLVWHALELSLDAQDADQIDRLWSRFLSFDTGSVGAPCNCR